MAHPLPALLSSSTVTGGALIVTWEAVDVAMRIGASLVAIISGILVALVAIRTLYKK